MKPYSNPPYIYMKLVAFHCNPLTGSQTATKMSFDEIFFDRRSYMVDSHFTANGFFGKVSQQTRKVSQHSGKVSQHQFIYMTFKCHNRLLPIFRRALDLVGFCILGLTVIKMVSRRLRTNYRLFFKESSLPN